MIGVRALEAAEIVVLDVFNRADGQPISMSVVQQRLEQLRAHRPSCRCGLCGLAVRVRASRVFPLVQAGQRPSASRLSRMLSHDVAVAHSRMNATFPAESLVA